MFGPWVRITPFPKQAAFLLCQNFEAFYGGSAGGGKSDALLAAAAQYAHVPRYNAIIFRRTFPEHEEMIERSKEWWAGEGPLYNEAKSFWTFPGGARLHFGHMQREKDKYDYKSAQFDFVAYDESTTFTTGQLEYIPRSRMRRRVGSQVPLRVRYGSNPGGDDTRENILSHSWHVHRFGILTGHRQVASDGKPCAFFPATVYDNPFIEVEEYVAKLSDLSPVERARMLDGDWTVQPSGGVFEEEMFPDPTDRWRLDEVDAAVRFWDLASTEDGDWTVGALVLKRDNAYQLAHIVRFRERPHVTTRRVKEVAKADGPLVKIMIEQEPGASGVRDIDDWYRELAAYDVSADKPAGNKPTRARPMAAAIGNKIMEIADGTWRQDFISEALGFPRGEHDDQVDAVSGAYAACVDAYEWAVVSASA